MAVQRSAPGQAIGNAVVTVGVLALAVAVVAGVQDFRDGSVDLRTLAGSIVASVLVLGFGNLISMVGRICYSLELSEYKSLRGD